MSECFVVSCNATLYLAPQKLNQVQDAVIWQQSCNHMTRFVGKIINNVFMTCIGTTFLLCQEEKKKPTNK
jgi:hypothetical protein